MAACTNPPQAWLPCDLPLVGRYVDRELRLDGGERLAWTPLVGVKPDIFVHDVAVPCTAAQLANRVYYQGQPQQPVLVRGVPHPNQVWSLFAPGSITGLASPDGCGGFTVWAMPVARAATLLALVQCSTFGSPPRVYLTVDAQPGTVSPRQRPRLAYLHLCS